AAAVLADFAITYPQLHTRLYDLADFDAQGALADADVVIVHEWNAPSLVRRLGELRREGSFRLLFHDTHHRAVSAPEELARFDLSQYDGVLAFGEVLREIYRDRGWSERAWTWHEAADVRIFHPRPEVPKTLDLVWIGNWGDGERARELDEFLLGPVRRAGLRARVHGVRYPDEAMHAMQQSHIAYGGWLANFQVPRTFATARCTLHIPRRFYREQLPGIPTIRVFEALACGIPLLCAPWDDSEALFTADEDYVTARDGCEMERQLRALQADPELAAARAAHGLKTIRERHTCAHRARELLGICSTL
ncbi:MAG: glycosyltransferase, partial [Sinobacteraceae bacterium]|nr:glycosyltransferase [Nevskiaceae bacterium]